MTGTLDGRVALVTGASRGVGKGIAQALGEAGATVYLTGRSADGGEPTTSLPGTIEQTAAVVAERAVPVRCDHRDDESVRSVFDRIEREQGRLDVLVNNVWGGYELLHEGRYETFDGPFWKAPLSMWDGMFDLPALMAEHLREHRIAVVSLYPGLVRTEGVMKWKDYLDLSNSESPRFVGRAVVGLVADERVLDRSGETVVVAEVAHEYGFTDEDGAQPRSLREQYEVAR